MVPAARREGRATCCTTSSSGKQCLAMRTAIKVARESWNERSLTYKIRRNVDLIHGKPKRVYQSWFLSNPSFPAVSVVWGDY